ncbi:MAG TPA: type VI secretion system protein TssA [Thermoanaerobaculia bacterium]|nr:type VI secretion system protein TssA [Thermoanaerobaculia bacterium]
MRLTTTPGPGFEEIERLLAPISPEAPAGEWLRFEPVYDEIKRLREEDDATLPRGVWQRELKRADWAGVAGLCGEALATRSKDLQLGAWLAEAWIHQHGFPGLERGLQLLAGLCRGFWEGLHPPIEDGSAEARLAPIGWAADKLLLPLKRVPVTAPSGEDAASYGWADWEAGNYLANLARLDAAAATKAQDRGMVPQSKFLVSVSLTPAPWLGGLAREVARALAAVDELETALADKATDAAPSLTPLRAPLVAIQAFVTRVLEERGETTSYIPAPAQAEEPTIMEAETSAPARTGAITSRADAYQRLNEAADYLQRTEPHSPVPYLVRRAVSWGNMSLSELLQELLQKNADLPTIYALLGIKRST